MTHVNHYKYKLALLSLKYIPIITAFMMLCHVVTLLLGKDFVLAETIAGISFLPFIVLYLFSEALEFCWIHKSMTLYTLLVDCCISIQKYIGFGSLLFILRLCTLILGIYLFYNLIKNFKEFYQYKLI
jgi:hypothetical protein